MKRLIFLLLTLITWNLSVNALSVASDYLVNNTLELISSESKIYGIRLQNPTENEVLIKLDYDPTFVKIIGYKEVYNVPPKETGYSISFNVTAPKKPGAYTVSYTVSEVEPSGAGGLPIILKINRSFNLKVIDDPNKIRKRNDRTAYAIIVLLALLYIFIKRYAKKGRIDKKRRKP